MAILLHGYGQALDEERALAAWRKEYAVLNAYNRLLDGRVTPTSCLGEKRARQMTGQLRDRPFGGMVLIAPVTPIPYYQRDLEQSLRLYSMWLRERLLPRVSTLVPVSTDPERVGLAGFSMGGLVGLELMWRYPELFGAYCGIQIAIDTDAAPRYAWLLQRALRERSGVESRPLRVVTANLDTYRSSNVALYRALSHHDLNASFELRRGSHTSRWMRSAGSLEALLWLDRVLNRPS